MEDKNQTELEKHLPEWFLLLRKIVAENLHKHSSQTDEASTKTVLAEERDANKPVEVNA